LSNYHKKKEKFFFNKSLFIETLFYKSFRIKRYHYSFGGNFDLELARKRITCWAEFSSKYLAFQTIKLNYTCLKRNGMTIEIAQEPLNRLPHKTGESQSDLLNILKKELNNAWDMNLVHGDLNRKNILLTTEGYRIVDIEPLLRVPLGNNQFALRTTHPYLAEEDRKNWDVTRASDKLGFDCFAAWIRGEVEQPAMASPPPPSLPPL
tara:strand:- start:496 stop:1116 length:621 start_codon:yes stop_codon:yes gene_type:complete